MLLVFVGDWSLSYFFLSRIAGNKKKIISCSNSQFKQHLSSAQLKV